jgi:hypothetical protein
MTTIKAEVTGQKAPILQGRVSLAAGKQGFRLVGFGAMVTHGYDSSYEVVPSAEADSLCCPPASRHCRAGLLHAATLWLEVYSL